MWPPGSQVTTGREHGTTQMWQRKTTFGISTTWSKFRWPMTTQVYVLPGLQSVVDHMTPFSISDQIMSDRSHIYKHFCSSWNHMTLQTSEREFSFMKDWNKNLLKENIIKHMGLSSRVSFEDLVLVLFGVGLKRSVPTETLQTHMDSDWWEVFQAEPPGRCLLWSASPISDSSLLRD